MFLTILLTTLTLLSLGLTLWQWEAARRFPLHQRIRPGPPHPGITILKPLKGCDEETAGCLRSWLLQDYPGPVQILFGVASGADPVSALVQRLLEEHPQQQAELVVCAEKHGANAKVSTLITLEALARHEVLVVSDADVHAPPDLLGQLVAQLQNERLGLVNCFYSLANPRNLAMHLEAVAVNADFWAQVLQANALRPPDFALGAVMATTREQLHQAGGFAPLANYLADDFELGRRIADHGGRIDFSPVVVECRSAVMSWREVWTHQLRWARTIRACRPVPYLFSILANATFWPLLLLTIGSALPHGSGTPPAVILSPSASASLPGWSLLLCLVCLLVRILTAAETQHRLTALRPPLVSLWIPLLKDLVQVVLLGLAFTGRQVSWQGVRLQLGRDGKLIEPQPGGWCP